MKRNLSHSIYWLATASFVVTVLATAAFGQVLPKNKAPARQPTPAAPAAAPTVAPVAPAPAAPTAGETAGQTRREGRQEAREERADAKSAGETRPQARETARETRQETRQNIQATRGADMGVWFNSRAANGLMVSDLTRNSVFSNAGLRAGDQIVSINGQPITTEAQFVQTLTAPNLGTQPVQVVVLRSGQQQTLTVQPTALSQGIVNHDPLYQYGLLLNSQNPNQLVVQQVYPRTPAYYAGIQQGDVITSLGGQRVTNLNAFTQGLSQANGAIPLQITRSGQARDLQLEALGNADSAVRTALRPNLDAGAGAPARVPDSDTVAPRTPDSNTVLPRTPDSTTAPPRTPATAPSTAPAAPSTAPAPEKAGAPSRATPATPATPAAPAAPGASPATPATPPTPATPVQPGNPGGAAPATGATPTTPGASGAAGASGTGGTVAPR